jgi:hypothetical protein
VCRPSLGAMDAEEGAWDVLSNGADDVFEIREYIDDEGNEVRSEKISVRDAMQEIEPDHMLEMLKRVKEEAQGGSSAAKEGEGGKSALAAHDWEGIRKMATEIEKASMVPPPEDRSRQTLQGSGWKKGFLNGPSKPPASKAPAAPPTPQEDLHKPSKPAGAKRVTFNLPDPVLAEPEYPPETLLHDSGESGKPAAGTSGEVAFSGIISEREPMEARASREGPGPEPQGLPGGAAPVHRPAMSRFKARRLGLVDPDETSN